jgi:acetylornithine deacetylase/succinyl-diaminopimelate desuccinylase-like protein
VPALYHGPQGKGAHADLEWVPVSELVRAAKVYVLTALRFAGVAG